MASRSYYRKNVSNGSKTSRKAYRKYRDYEENKGASSNEKPLSRALIYEFNPQTKSINYVTAVPLYKYEEHYIGELGLYITGTHQEEKPPILAYYGYITCRKTKDGQLEAYVFSNLVTTPLTPSKIAPGYYEGSPVVISTSASTLPIWSNRLIKNPLIKFVLEE